MIWFEEKKCDFWRVVYREMQEMTKIWWKRRNYIGWTDNFLSPTRKRNTVGVMREKRLSANCPPLGPALVSTKREKPADCRQIILHYLNKRGKGTKKSWNDEIIRQLFSLPKGFLDEGSDFHRTLLDKCNKTPLQLRGNSALIPSQLP